MPIKKTWKEDKKGQIRLRDTQTIPFLPSWLRWIACPPGTLSIKNCRPPPVPAGWSALGEGDLRVFRLAPGPVCEASAGSYFYARGVFLPIVQGK